MESPMKNGAFAPLFLTSPVNQRRLICRADWAGNFV
jgi:hypothetical protein